MSEETQEKAFTVNKFRIHGFIKTLSPLHIASPESQRYDPTTDNPAYGDVGIPVTPVQKIKLPKVFQWTKTDPETEETKTYFKQLSMPFIAANTLNGGLRRVAAKIVFEALAAKKEKIKIGTYSGMSCGAVTANPEGGTVMFDEYREARKHPFVGLYGGGPRMIRRNVRVHNLIPINEHTEFIYRGASRHPRLGGPNSLFMQVAAPQNADITQSIIFNRKDDLEQLADIWTQEMVIEDYLSEIQKRQAKILEEKAKEKGETSTRVYSSLEFVVPGIYFPATFELEVSDAQMGLFLLALDHFAKTERLGGILRNGFGLFAMENFCLLNADSDEEIVSDLFTDGRLNRANDTVKNFLAAWEEAKKGLNAERLDYLMRPAPPKKDKKKGKKGVKESEATETEE